MSHIVQAKTKITNPNMDLLRQACVIVAGQHVEGEVTDHINDFYGKPVPVSSKIAIFTRQITRGIGIEIGANGEMSFKGDDYGSAYKVAYQQIQQEVVQTYTTLATMLALKQMGYNPEAGQQGQQTIIQGVTYA